MAEITFRVQDAAGNEALHIATVETTQPPPEGIQVNTLEGLLASYSSGDVVIVAPGTYGSRGGRYTLTSDDVTYVADGPVSLLGRYRISADFVTWDGFLHDGPAAGTHPLEVYPPPRSGVRVVNCEIRDSDYHAGIYLKTDEGTGNEVTNCHIYGTTGPDPSSTSADHGIYWSGGTDLKVTDCLLENNQAWGLHLYPGAHHGGLVEGNVMRSNGGGGMVLDDRNGPTENILIVRNEFRDNLLRGGIFVGGGGLSGSGNVADDNFFCGNSPDEVTGGSGLTVTNSRRC